MSISLYSIILGVLVMLSILLVLTNIHFKNYKAMAMDSIFTLCLIGLFVMSLD